MAVLVKEIMNRELFSVKPEEAAEEALGYILALGITAAPVLDEGGRPRGMLSLRDATGSGSDLVADRMSSPAATVSEAAPIEAAGRLLAETGYHRLVVVGGDGRAVGMVSSLDVVRGLLGLPAPHPAQFPHYDRERGLTWTDDTPLDADRIEAAPDGPGVLVLVEGGARVPDRAVWVEASKDVRKRLLDLTTMPQREAPALAQLLEHQNLRFRAAHTRSVAHARHVADDMLRSAHGVARPNGRH